MSFSSFFAFLEKAIINSSERAEKRRALFLKFEEEYSNKSQEQLLDEMRRNPEGSIQYLAAKKVFEQRDFTLG